MLDGNVLLRQKRDEVPKGTLSCPNRNMANSQRHCHNEGVRLLPSTCDCELIQQTLFSVVSFIVVYLCYGEDVIRSFMLTSDVLQQNSAWGRVYAAKNAIGLFDIHPLIGNGVGSYFELINEKLFQDVSGYTSFAPNVICK